MTVGERALSRETHSESLAEPQLTGFRAPAPAKVAKNRTSAKAGRQVDPTGGILAQWEGYLNRPLGREARTIAAIKAIRDLDPQVSQGVWNFLRLMNPGFDLKAMVGGPGTGLDEELEEGDAQAYLDELVKRVGGEYGGGGDQLHNVLSLSVVTNGALALEVTPTEDLEDTEDWYPIDPIQMAFKRMGPSKRMTLGQRFRDGTFVTVNPEQVFFLPIDPDVDDPYGRPPLVSAVSAAMAKAALINDLRAAAHNAGTPRLDVKVVWDALKANAPAELQQPNRANDLQEWMSSALNQLVREYESLQVDDTFVHFEWVEVGVVGGAASGGGTMSFDFKGLMDVLIAQLNSAIKTLPILLGINDSTTESHGSVQWQIQVAGVKALQKLVKRVIERAANVSLQLAGFFAHAQVVYDEIRTIDRVFEAQADVLETTVLKAHVAMGWRDDDEAAQIATGHPAVGDALPGSHGETVQTTGTTPDGENANQTQAPGSNEKKAPDPAALVWDAAKQLAADVPPRRAAGAAARQPWTGTELEDRLVAYERRARALFDDAGEVLLELLRQEGIVDEVRTVAADIADSVFGLGYSRDMKRLLREAIVEGMVRGGMTDPVADERLVRRVWNENRQYVLRIRNDLRTAIRDGQFATVADVSAWLNDNGYREELMGRYLAKQGLEGGYARGTTEGAPDARFIWQLGGSKEHCGDCLSRFGQMYSYEELLSIGMPGSGSLECKSGCHCSLARVA